MRIRRGPQRAMRISALLIAAGLGAAAEAASTRAIQFTNAQRQAAEFIRADSAIPLTAAQQKTMKDALSAMPAPCCADYSMATCCCPCNLAKSAWGLSKILIVKHRQSAEQVRRAVAEWMRFINPGGFSGDVCFSPGGCNRPFDHNGCGGMKETELAAR
jgi:hypothetical protein